ncbi:MAG: hypothetical protein DWQ31_16980 [Planctomycetota bacterium]|nr:MAG: hypothetical protein DWQ31_16980 [Planctomycetota bacterium]REJ92049.1 MAG: hypothetical protein DWQ35_12930 [Planctomycetota bacterium]REK28585.1 MAG: hypothetical protein DWQ42_04520 [Planctomycetota bacterium]REK39200.1 MAG: hypothetical protein DWQ46_18105 [Planctomycetota bacterium]
MTVVNRSLTRRIQHNLYMLKRQYGGTVSVYRLNDSRTDVRTGDKTIDKNVFVVDRAIILPVKISREVIQSISQISANKAFVYGGSFDAGVRQFIIDTRDLPAGFLFTNDDWLVYNHRRYEIKAINEFEFAAAWVLIGKEIMGRVPEQIFPVAADNFIALAADSAPQ